MASNPGGFDMDFELPSNPAAAFAGLSVDGDEYVRCSKCGYGGCDLRVSGCGCTLHARCVTLNADSAMPWCPQCNKPTDGMILFPMSFREIDDAKKASTLIPATKNRGRKRKGGADAAASADEAGSYISERRTGRWTNEEMALCDKLIERFEAGHLPIEEGSKLNEFLGNMLKSKQSRLTKKMKNAKLSTRLYERTTGCLDAADARLFSELEESFFQAVQDAQERAEIKFHMQKEWREQFSRVCSAIGQPLDADAWLSSVEEMDRRASQAKNSARIARRKLMVGVALRTDTRNPDQGVFIEKTDAENRLDKDGNPSDSLLDLLTEDTVGSLDFNVKSSLYHSAPFLGKVTSYLQRHGVPFEHVDLWVPSFVPGEGGMGLDDGLTSCRLCYAGSATVDKLVLEDGKTTRPLSQDEQFNFLAFGDYSQKFSFDVGCGLPGRVYESGRPTWEQSVHNAPHHHFERCGGAQQWGIKTVIGIPIASPNVGRIVATLYSTFDRQKDEDLVSRLSEEFTRLLPSPKWKLVVDIGESEESVAAPAAAFSSHVATDFQAEAGLKDAADFSLLVNLNSALPVASGSSAASEDAKESRDARIEEVVSLIGEFMPSESTSPLTPYVPGFMTLRLLLLRTSRSRDEEELVKTILDSYTSYSVGGRERSEIVVMLARDFIFLSQQHIQQQAPGQGFMGLGHGMLSAAPMPGGNGLSLFGLPSTISSLQNSPALTPIPAPGSIDALSIVSN